MWEYLGEWDEQPSTNDLIFTPAGGAVIGEATYRLGRMFAAGSPSMGNCMGALLFSPIATLNEARVCRSNHNQPTDDFGLPTRTWHYLSFNLGQSYGSFDGGAISQAVDLGLDVAIVDHRGYRQPGTGLTAVSPGDWTELVWDNLISHGGLRGLQIHADGVWWGRYYRNYAAPDESAHRETDGWGLMLGLGSTFDFDSRVLPLEWDRVVTAGLAGPMVEYADRHGGLIIRATLNAQYGFSMVTSLAFAGAAVAFADNTDQERARRERVLLRAKRDRRRHALAERRADRALSAGARRRLLVDQPRRSLPGTDHRQLLASRPARLSAGGGHASHPRRTAARRPRVRSDQPRQSAARLRRTTVSSGG